MARIRTIKPEFWEDEVVGSLSRDARLLFIACLNIADDEGLLRWSSPYIKSSAFMYDDDIGVNDCQKLMDELTEAQLFFSYNAGKSKQPFAYIVNFHKHQKINRPGPSRLPAPPLCDQRTVAMYRRRDGNLCHLCGGEIDQHAGGKDEFLISLDHINPVSKGGTDHPTNIKSAHQTCNKGRGNRTVEAYKELIIAGKTNAQARYPERFTEQFTELGNEAPPADLVSSTVVPSTVDLVSSTLPPIVPPRGEKPNHEKPKPTRLPEDWKPSQKDIFYATDKGLDPQTTLNLVEGFVNHWRAKPSKNTSLDWSRNWRTWVGNHINWNGTAAWPANGTRQPGRNNGTADALSSYVRKYIIGEPVSDGPGVQGTGRDGFDPDASRGRLGNGQGHTGPIIDADEFERVPEAARQT